MSDILRRLNAAAERLPNDAGPHCQLGRAYRWLEQWPAALRESEIVPTGPGLRPSALSTRADLSSRGSTEKAKQEMSLYAKAAAKRVADENARRDETMKTFLYSIQKETPDHP